MSRNEDLCDDHYDGDDDYDNDNDYDDDDYYDDDDDNDDDNDDVYCYCYRNKRGKLLRKK